MEEGQAHARRGARGYPCRPAPEPPWPVRSAASSVHMRPWREGCGSICRPPVGISGDGRVSRNGAVVHAQRRVPAAVARNRALIAQPGLEVARSIPAALGRRSYRFGGGVKTSTLISLTGSAEYWSTSRLPVDLLREIL